MMRQRAQRTGAALAQGVRLPAGDVDIRLPDAGQYYAPFEVEVTDVEIHAGWLSWPSAGSSALTSGCGP
jgi:hypothetical protein